MADEAHSTTAGNGTRTGLSGSPMVKRTEVNKRHAFLQKLSENDSLIERYGQYLSILSFQQ